MNINRKLLSLPMAVGLLAALAIIVGGVTFAALRSQNNYITGSRMTSASADLYISKNNSQYTNSMAGYDFADLAPGGQAMPLVGHDLYFRNAGSTNLDLRVSLNPARLTNPNGVALQKARVVITDETGSAMFSQATLAELIDAYTTNTTVPLNLIIGRGTTEHLKIRMKLDDGAFVTTSQAGLDNIDLVFSGVVPNS